MLDYRHFVQHFVNFNAFSTSKLVWKTKYHDLVEFFQTETFPMRKVARSMFFVQSIFGFVNEWWNAHCVGRKAHCLCLSQELRSIWTDIKKQWTQMHLLMHKGNENLFEMQRKSNQCECCVQGMRKQWQRRQPYPKSVRRNGIHFIPFHCQPYYRHAMASKLCSWCMPVNTHAGFIWALSVGIMVKRRSSVLLVILGWSNTWLEWTKKNKINKW